VAFRKSMNVLTFLPLQIQEARWARRGWWERWYDISGSSEDWLKAIFERNLFTFTHRDQKRYTVTTAAFFSTPQMKSFYIPYPVTISLFWIHPCFFPITCLWCQF